MAAPTVNLEEDAVEEALLTTEAEVVEGEANPVTVDTPTWELSGDAARSRRRPRHRRFIWIMVIIMIVKMKSYGRGG